MPNAIQLTAIYAAGDRDPDAWHLASATDELPTSLWGRFSLQHADAQELDPDSITVTLSRDDICLLDDLYHYCEADPLKAEAVRSKWFDALQAHDARLASLGVAVDAG